MRRGRGVAPAAGALWQPWPVPGAPAAAARPVAPPQPGEGIQLRWGASGKGRRELGLAQGLLAFPRSRTVWP